MKDSLASEHDERNNSEDILRGKPGGNDTHRGGGRILRTYLATWLTRLVRIDTKRIDIRGTQVSFQNRDPRNYGLKPVRGADEGRYYMI